MMMSSYCQKFDALTQAPLGVQARIFELFMLSTDFVSGLLWFGWAGNQIHGAEKAEKLSSREGVPASGDFDASKYL